MEGIELSQDTLLKIGQKYGYPLYVYNGDVIKRQHNRLKEAFSGTPNFEVHYACKALTNINILKLMNSIGVGIDAVSIQEVELALHSGFKPEEILYTPNGVSLEEINKAVELGIGINIDNLSILEQFGQIHPNYPVCIRVNPHIMAGGNSKISVGHIDSKFGISFHQLPHILRIVNALNMNIEGVHMHTGSDILDIDVFLRASDILFDFASKFEDLKYINFGSGFKIPYKEGDIETDIESLGQKLTERFNEFSKSYGRELKLIIEPGKFLVSESGNFLAKVNVIKQTTSTVFAGVDSGLNHLIRPMFYNSHHEIENISNTDGKKRFYTVVGYICETDTFGVNRRIDEIKEGDVLKFKNAGAYCYSMASNYNSRYRPAEVLVLEGKDYLIRKRETMEDLLQNQVDVNILETKLQD